ncbi:hypothetical protein BJ165DRAFT_1528226 [Panaeolus papilionaceus]|nr:hypothetical protein BJ165DRAFT_1528226 [Panaeolus papilionaceus]
MITDPPGLAVDNHSTKVLSVVNLAARAYKRASKTLESSVGFTSSTYKIFKMFSRAVSFTVVALPILAAATAVPRNDGDCNTGDIKCCNSTMASSLTALATLGGLLGLSLPSIGGLIGLSCSPISVLGLGGNSW